MKHGILIYTLIPAASALIFFASALFFGFGTFRPVSLRVFAYYVLFSPLLEEIVFRAGLQRVLSERGFSLFAANAVASLVFACCHLFFSSPFHAAAVFFPSLVFGFVYGRTGSLYAAAFVHGGFNMNIFISYQSDILEKIF